MEVRLVSEKPNLLIDIGNSQLKYTWYERATSLANIKGKTIAIEDALSLFKDRPDVHFCSVKSNEITDEFIEMMRQAGVRFKQANTQKQQFGITNSYATVTNMGSDRWLAMLAADALVKKDVLVIDAGTAITCDFIVQGKHLGGWIAPGLKMLRESVANKTGRVFDFEHLTPHLLPGEDTANCVANGALAQIVGMVQQARTLIGAHTSDFEVIVSGGDKDIISRNIGFASLLHDNLVLAGLARICDAKSL
jgi:type III pantothenate kinase